MTDPDWPFDIKKQITPSRRLEKKHQNAADEFSGYVGKTIWSWNYSHAAFAHIFALTVNRSNLAIGHAMWHTMQSDASQRDLLMAAAEIAYSKNKTILRRLVWSKRVADKLATVRNDAAHIATAWTVGEDPKIVLSSVATAPKRFRRVTGYKSFETQLDLLCGDLIALSHFMYALGSVIAFPMHYPLPRRPKILSTPEFSLIPKKDRPGMNKARRPSSRSSH